MELLDRPKKIAGKTVGRIVAGAFALLVLAATWAKAQSPTDPKQKYPKMAPIDEYLMDRDAEIALARSAGPEAISKDASVLVLTRTGWETAVKGTSGFVCNVERGWTGSIDFPEMWNPKIKGADCLNPGAVRSILPLEYKLTQMTLAGVYSDKDRVAGIQAAYAKKEIPALEPGAMGYMMAKGSYLGDAPPTNFYAHVMFFVGTRKTDSEWGGWLAHVPLGTSEYWFPNPGTETPLAQELPPMRVLYIIVPKWSDGTSIYAK
ncbi:MAG: hypothetical protein WBE20_06375 [Candidatus Acidiferrales bacterium]